MMSSNHNAQGRVSRAVRDFFFGTENDPEDDSGDESESTVPPDDQTVAARIDQAFADAEEKSFMDSVKQSNIRVDILPSDPAWQPMRKMVQDTLNIPDTPIDTVMDWFLTQEQKLLLVSFVYHDGIVLELQKHNELLYKEALGPAGAFYGQKDNIITKITMAHFGLPVAPITYENCVNAGMDNDDPEDTPPVPPRVQRIMFAEKPLEFLDKYHERSHGYPMIRRIGKPKEPYGLVSLRGGSGGSPAQGTHHLYSHYNGRQPLTAPEGADGHPEVPEAEFLDLALRMAGLDPNSNWSFTVDQYRNQKLNKTQREKLLVNSFAVTKSNFAHMYDQYIKDRVSNTLHDWVMVVRGNKQPHQAPPKYTMPRADSIGNPPVAAAPNTGPAVSNTAPAVSVPNPVPNHAPKPTTTPVQQPDSNLSLPKKRVYCHDRNNYREFTNSSTDFDRAWRALLSILATESPAMKINFYSSQLGGSIRFQHHVLYSPIEGNRLYDSQIGSVIFRPGSDWKITIQRKPVPDVAAAPLWPPWSKTTTTSPPPPAPMTHKSRNNGRLYAKNGTAFKVLKQAQPSHTAKRFIDAIKKAVGITNPNMWRARIECHSLQLHHVDHNGNPQPGYQYKHHRNVDQDNAVRYFNQTFSKYLFESGDDWYLRVVPTDDNSRLPAPDALPAQGISREATPIVSPVEPPPEPPSERLLGEIYGYAGRWAIGSEAELLPAILQLLNTDPSTDWWFRATIYKEDGMIDTVLTIKKADWAQHHAIIAAARVTSGTEAEGRGNFRVFVHRSVNAPANFAQVKPPSTYLSVVELSRRTLTSYWKIPNNVATRHGVNQYQGNFFKAMEVHWNAHQRRPRPHTAIDELGRADLGFGGMELGEQDMEDLRRLIAAAPNARHNLTLRINNWPQTLPEQTTIGLRMIGNNFTCGANDGDYAEMGRQIREMCEVHVYGGAGRLPMQFRLWRSARDREHNTANGFALIDLAPPARAGQIQSFLEIDAKPLNCLIFRPEWLNFTIIEASSPSGGIQTAGTRVEWDIATGSTLQSFRHAVANLFKTGNPSLTDADARTAALNFEIANAQWYDTEGHTTRFVITNATTELEWRKDVLDWLPGSTLYVTQKTGLDYVVDPTPVPWGIPENEVLPQAPRPPQDAPSQPIQMLTTRINKPRIVKPRAQRPKPVKFDPWQAEQNRLNRLQRESYIKDAYAIEPGQDPQPLMFGKPRDNVLSSGQGMPEVYLRNLTATDIAQIELENRQIRNRNLDRQLTCGMCNVAFPANDSAAITAHYKEHADAIAAAGKCPLCETEGWVFMDMDHKKDHLQTHFEEIETEKIRDFYEGLVCPVCQDDLHEYESQKVVDHIAGHTPSLIRFCDRCGLDAAKASVPEMSHHEKTCRGWNEAEDIMPPHFCSQCGRTRKINETNKERREHALICRPPENENCEQCGLDLTSIYGRDYDTHHERCKPPRGHHGVYCRRCGLNVAQMDEMQRRQHKKDCLDRPPFVPGKDPRIPFLEGLIRKQRTTEYKLKAMRGNLNKREKDLTEREQAVNNSTGKFSMDAHKDLQKKLDDCLERERKRSQTTATGDTNVDTDVGRCPIPHCEHPTIGKYSRAGLYAHLQYHADNAYFNYPITLPAGGACGVKVCIRATTPSAPMIGDHLQHKTSGASLDEQLQRRVNRLSLQLHEHSAGARATNAAVLDERNFWNRVVTYTRELIALINLSDTDLGGCATFKSTTPQYFKDLEDRAEAAIGAFKADPSQANRGPIDDLVNEFRTAEATYTRNAPTECDNREQNTRDEINRLVTVFDDLVRGRPASYVDANDQLLSDLRAERNGCNSNFANAQQTSRGEYDTITKAIDRIRTTLYNPQNTTSGAADFLARVQAVQDDVATFVKDTRRSLGLCSKEKVDTNAALDDLKTRVDNVVSLVDAEHAEVPLTFRTEIQGCLYQLNNLNASWEAARQSKCNDDEDKLERRGAAFRERHNALEAEPRPADLTAAARSTAFGNLESALDAAEEELRARILKCGEEGNDINARIRALLRLINACIARPLRRPDPSPVCEAYLALVRDLQTAITGLLATTQNDVRRCENEKDEARARLDDLRPRVTAAINAIPAAPAIVSAANITAINNLHNDTLVEVDRWNRSRHGHCNQTETELARQAQLLVNRFTNEIEGQAPAGVSFTPAEQTEINSLQTSLTALQTLVDNARQSCAVESADIAGRLGALTDQIEAILNRIAAQPQATTTSGGGPGFGGGGRAGGSGGSSNGGGGGGSGGNSPDSGANSATTGFRPLDGYRVRGSPRKTSPRKRSAATSLPSKTGSKRKRDVPKEDDSFVPMPYLDVGTPATFQPRTKRARTDDGSEEGYLVVDSLASAPPPRRSTRATSGTPALGPSNLVVKKARGRPKKEAEDRDG